MKLIFSIQMNKVFFMFIPTFRMCVARLAFCNISISLLQYLKKSVKNEADFLPADKQQNCLQLIPSFLMDRVKHAGSSKKKKKFTIFLQYLRKEVKTSINARNWFTYTYFKQIWSGISPHAQHAYTDIYKCFFFLIGIHSMQG